MLLTHQNRTAFSYFSRLFSECFCLSWTCVNYLQYFLTANELLWAVAHSHLDSLLNRQSMTPNTQLQMPELNTNYIKWSILGFPKVLFLLFLCSNLWSRDLNPSIPACIRSHAVLNRSSSVSIPLKVNKNNRNCDVNLGCLSHSKKMYEWNGLLHMDLVLEHWKLAVSSMHYITTEYL